MGGWFSALFRIRFARIEQEDSAMAIAKGLHPAEARRCAAEMESIVWAMIVILLALSGFGIFLFITKIS
jgi:hypothetical protein